MTVQIQRDKFAFLLPFFSVWFLYFGLLALLDLLGFHTNYHNIWLAVFYQVTFVALVSLPIVVFPIAAVKGDQQRGSTQVITVGLVFSAVAIFCLFAGKIASGVDYGAGACMARNQMIEIAMRRTGASPTNVFGYLFGLSFFVSTSIVITQTTSRRVFWTTISASVACLMALSEVAASRSSILLYFAFIAALVAIRFILGRSLPQIRKLDVVVSLFLLMIALAFVLSMFSCRATASGLTTKGYMREFVPFLGAETAHNVHPGSAPVTTYNIPEGAPVKMYNKIVGLLGITALYATHSAFTFAAILEMPPDDGHALFIYPMMLLARLGLITTPNGDWELAGRFTSLPGGIFHDFRLTGLIVGSIFLGSVIWLVICLVRLRPANVFLIGATAAVITVAILSPIHSAFDFLGFPFFCFSFVAVPLAARALRHVWPNPKASQ
jgi:hypothetical protein